MMVKKNMKKCYPSLRRVCLTVSQQLVFSQQQRTRVFGCRCASARHRAVRKNRHEAGQRLTNADVPSCRQTRPARWRAANSECWCAIVLSEKTNALASNEIRVLMCNCAVRKDTHAGLQRIPSADVPSCCQKRQTRWRATNSECWCAIVRSEKTHTLACNEFQVLMCHRAIRKDTHAGTRRIRLLMRLRAVRKEKHKTARRQLIWSCKQFCHRVIQLHRMCPQPQASVAICFQEMVPRSCDIVRHQANPFVFDVIVELRLPRKCIFADPPQMTHAYHHSWKSYKTFTFWSLTRCTMPYACHAKRYLNLQKWREHVVFCIFWLRNMLRATTACTFSTSQLVKVARTPSGLYILTWKCASCHNGVHFFDISTSKSGPKLVYFIYFDFEICFAPQRHALFRHLNCQKRSAPLVFCTFWLANMFRAITAYNFSSFIWPANSAPAALASLLFDSPGPQIIGKTQCFATFLPFLASTSSYSFSSTLFSSNLSLLSASSLLYFSSVRIVGSLTSKLPSIIKAPAMVSNAKITILHL